METLNTIYGWRSSIKEVQKEIKIVNSTNNPQNSSIDEQLEKLFWLQNKEFADKRESLSEENEINTTEYKLAKMFGKEKEMIKLNWKKALSIEWVLSELESLYS